MDNGKDTSSSSPAGEGLHVTFDPRSKSPKTYPTLCDGDTEKFPVFPPGTKSGQKSRSLTQAEINMGVMKEEEVAALGERLQTEPPPMSLQEARERRASIKEERKRSIEFIRRRTNSRAAANGRPSMEVLDQSGAAANGYTSLDVLKEDQRKE